MIHGTPSTLDTLDKIAQVIQKNNIVDVFDSVIGNKINLTESDTRMHDEEMLVLAGIRLIHKSISSQTKLY